MQDRRALIVDKDRRFADRLTRLLGAAGIGAIVVDSRRDALERLVEAPPSILFLAVEQPKRAGFALFSDVKRIARQTPVVLLTSTVSPAEMSLHQKLRIHADAYLDRRDLDDATILETVSDLLSLGIDEDEARRITGEVAGVDDAPEAADAAAARDTEAPSDRSEGTAVEPVLAALLSELGVDSPQLAPISEPPPEVEPDPVADARLADLERRLEAARQAARSSPFSSDYLALVERVEHAERGAASAKRELAARARLAEKQRATLVQLAARLLDEERGRREATERNKTLEAECARFQEELRRSQDAIVSLDRQVSAERRRAEEESRSQAGALAALEHQSAEQKRRAEAAAREAAESHAEALREGIARRDAEWERRVEKLRAEHKAELSRTGDEHRRRLAELQASLQKALDRNERQTAAEMLKAADEHEQAVERIVAEWQARLTQTEQALRGESKEALASQDLKYRETVSEMGARHRAECERLRQESAAHAASLRSKLEREAGSALDERQSAWRTQIDAARAEHAQALEAQREKHAAEVQGLRSKLEREAASTLDERQSAWRAQLDTVRAQHVREIETQREKHAAEVQGLRAQLEREAASTLDGRQSAWKGQIDTLRAEHARELESERQRHAAEVAGLRAKLEREAGSTLDERQAAWKAQVEAARAEHAREIEAERQRHATETNRQAAAHERALLDQARKHEETLAQALDEMRGERVKDGTRRLDELEEAERRHRAELVALEQRYRDEIQLLSQLHDVELERASVRHGAGRDPLLVELSHKLPTQSGAKPAGAPANDEIRRAIEALEAESRSQQKKG